MRNKLSLICLLLAVSSGMVCVRANAGTGQDSTAQTAQKDASKPGDAATALTPEKEKSIRKLLELTGAAKLGVQISRQLIASMRQSQTSVPEEFWTEFAKKIKPDELVDLVVPIYAKYYSQEDVDGLISFYQSPLGQKVLSTLPQVSTEAMQAGQQWGQSIGEQVMRDIQKRYGQPDKTTKKDTTKSTSKPKPKSKP